MLQIETEIATFENGKYVLSIVRLYEYQGGGAYDPHWFLVVHEHEDLSFASYGANPVRGSLWCQKMDPPKQTPEELKSGIYRVSGYHYQLSPEDFEKIRKMTPQVGHKILCVKHIPYRCLFLGVP